MSAERRLKRSCMQTSQEIYVTVVAMEMSRQNLANMCLSVPVCRRKTHTHTDGEYQDDDRSTVHINRKAKREPVSIKLLPREIKCIRTRDDSALDGASIDAKRLLPSELEEPIRIADEWAAVPS